MNYQIEHIKKLIQDGELELALSELHSISKEVKNELLEKDIIQCMSKLSLCKKAFFNGSISMSEKTVEINRITSHILDLINTTQVRRKKPILSFISGVYEGLK